MTTLLKSIFSIQSAADFAQCCLAVFRFQAQHCPVYREYLRALDIHPQEISAVAQIPCLPIAFFKTRTIVSSPQPAQLLFTSSGTTGTQPSRHFVTDVAVYEQSFLTGFRRFYGPPSDYTLLALLPSYLEREGSSLVYMVERLMAQSAPGSGFYLHDFAALHRKLQQLQLQQKQVLLMGVSYALLDFAEQYPVRFPELIVMETGGMKGRREELPKQELHRRLERGFGVEGIHSEYGMTELLSQAYSCGAGIFRTPPWMQVRIRDRRDPFVPAPTGATGGVNVIDLANVFSCAFIETQDLGKVYPDNSFEILGRFAQSDIRGCNLMYEQ
jgi:phenylacetate-coenzyme A ligase PaaK-like adenylate-forming protein